MRWNLVAAAADCRSTDVDRSELFIVEGDSALGTAKLARNSEFQAQALIRGKILNVQKASVGDMLKNAECASIIQVVGAGSGRSFDIETARYGKIIFMADADSDGVHPLSTRHPAAAAGRRRPGVHRRTAAAPIRADQCAKGPGEVHLHHYLDAEYQRKAAGVDEARTHLQGAAALQRPRGDDADQPAETTMSPRHRTLRRMTVDDGLIAETTFEMLMGNDVGPRKDFIIDGAYLPDAAAIDA